jgi:putative zinc finger/helix-turn-helix YgiT family protein
MAEPKCFVCNDGALRDSSVSLKGSRNGEEFAVTVQGMTCDSCGYQTIDNRQSGEFTKAVSDAYRRAHGLLTGVDIRERRAEWLEMSQQEFADYLGVGVASVKRWELGQIQDRAMDQLMRLKTDLQVARNNLRALGRLFSEDCVLSKVTLGGEEIDLCFSCEQSFTSQSQMQTGEPNFTVVDDSQLLVA